MAVVSAKNAFLSINGVTLADATHLFLDAIDGLLPDMGTEDSTTFGVSGRKEAATIQAASDFTLSWPYDDTATTGPDAVIAAAWAAAVAVPFIYGPTGNTTGMPKYPGSCIVTRYKPAAKAGSLLKSSATCKVTGGVTPTVW